MLCGIFKGMTILWTAVAAILALAALVLHELGHAAAFRDTGVPIKRLGVGLSLPPRLVIPPSGRRTFEIVLTPWVIAAYVLPDAAPEKLEVLPFRQSAWTSGAGVIVNVAVGATLTSVASLMYGGWLAAAIAAAVAVVAWIARRSLALAIVPAGILSLIFFAVSLTGDMKTGQSGGVVGIPALLLSATPQHAVVIGASVSFALALVNMIPLMPFDGGRVLYAMLLHWRGKRAATASALVGGIGFAVVMLAALLSDALHLTGLRL
jgi:membrane-associated protease RseP (regulator of RpoE activity)